MSAPSIYLYHVCRGQAGPFCRLIRSNISIAAAAALLAYVIGSNTPDAQSKAIDVGRGREGQTDVVIDHQNVSPNTITTPVGAMVMDKSRQCPAHVDY
jgi:hypothetical protein